MTDEEKFERSIAFSLKWEGGQNFTVVNGKPVIKGAAKADAGGATIGANISVKHYKH